MDFYYAPVSVSWQYDSNRINAKKNLANIQLSWPHSSRSIAHNYVSLRKQLFLACTPRTKSEEKERLRTV